MSGPSWPWSYGSWIYNYLCYQCLLSLTLWVRILLMARCTLCDKVCQWLVTGLWFSPGTPVSSINKTDWHDITEILLKVALNTITSNPKSRCQWINNIYYWTCLMKHFCTFFLILFKPNMNVHLLVVVIF